MQNFARYYVSLRLKFQLHMANNQQGETYNRIKVVLVEVGCGCQISDMLNQITTNQRNRNYGWI